MGYKQKVLSLAEQMGVEVTQRDREVVMEAPDGHLFTGPQVHGVVASKWDDESFDDLWKRSLDDLRDGIEPCTDDECEICHPDEESE